MSSVRLRRLKSDYEAMRLLVNRHPRIDIEGVSGSPPDRYILVLEVQSVRERAGAIEPQSTHRLEVRLPLGYPRDPPVCRMLTPVFHPNIAPHAVCIGDHWSAAERLDLMIQRVGEMLGYQSYNIKSPLNGRAAQWVETNPGLVPTEQQEFFIDLSAVPVDVAAEAMCSNCAATAGPLETCASGGHILCGDCLLRCDGCERILCLVCGDSHCPACIKVCANCGGAAKTPAVCAAEHALCSDCAVICPSCSRLLCLACGTYPCPACQPAM